MIMNHITFILIFEQPVRCILRITSDIAVPYLLLLFEKETLVNNIVTMSWHLAIYLQ